MLFTFTALRNFESIFRIQSSTTNVKLICRTNSTIFEVNSIASQRFLAFWVINNCIIFVLLLKPITLQAKELIEPSLYCFLSDYSFVTTKLQFCIFFTRFLRKLVLPLLHGIGNGISAKFSSSFSKYNFSICIIRIL